MLRNSGLQGIVEFATEYGDERLCYQLWIAAAVMLLLVATL